MQLTTSNQYHIIFRLHSIRESSSWSDRGEFSKYVIVILNIMFHLPELDDSSVQFIFVEIVHFFNTLPFP